MLNTFHWKLALSRRIRILPHFTACYRILLHFTAFYRILGCTDLRISVSRAKFDAESDFEVHLAVAPQKPKQNNEKLIFRSKFSSKKNFDVEKWNVGVRLKRVFPKFRADRSHVWGVDGRSKFRKKIEIREKCTAFATKYASSKMYLKVCQWRTCTAYRWLYKCLAFQP